MAERTLSQAPDSGISLDPIAPLARIYESMIELHDSLDWRSVEACKANPEDHANFQRGAEIGDEGCEALRLTISYLSAISHAGALRHIDMATTSADCLTSGLKTRFSIKEGAQAERHLNTALPALQHALGIAPAAD